MKVSFWDALPQTMTSAMFDVPVMEVTFMRVSVCPAALRQKDRMLMTSK